MKKITKSEWDKIHPDYKSEGFSGKKILINEDGATVLVPVKILRYKITRRNAWDTVEIGPFYDRAEAEAECRKSRWDISLIKEY